MVRIRKGEVAFHIEVNDLAQVPLAGEHDAGKLKSWQEDFTNFCFWLLVTALEGKDGFNDNRVSSSNAERTLFNPLQVRRCFR
jgi:hypothetical protein